MRKETAPVSGSFGIHGSVAPAGGKELQKVVSRVFGICNDFPCPDFPGS